MADADEKYSETQPLVSGDDSTSEKPLKKRGGKKRTWELNAAIEKIGNGKFQLMVGLICGFAQLTDGIQQLSVGFLLHSLGKIFGLTNHGKAMIGTVSGAGMLVGSITWGRLSDMYGRKMAMVGTLLMSAIFGMLSAMSVAYPMFLVFRFLSAVGVGGNVPLGFTVFTEFSTRHNRGAYLTLLEAFWSLGAVISCLLAWGMIPTAGWQWFTVLSAAPALALAVVVYFIMPESPRFLLVTGQKEKAEEALDAMALANGKGYLMGKKLDMPAGSENQIQGFASSFISLFSLEYLWSTLPLFGIYFALSFGCGVFVWMPVLLEAKNLEVQSMYRSMVIMALSQIPGVITSAYLVEKVGRLWAIGSFFFFGAVSLVIFAVARLESIVVIASIFMEFFLAGVNGSLSAYTVEVFPTSMRSTAMGACSALSRLSSVVNPAIWAALLNVSVAAATYAGAVSLLIGLVLLFLLPVETATQDIQDFTTKKKN